ncbi:phage portal protein [Leuconostoc mesenteroides]|uniref:phage portal protein n=1 Tax=Leuconostoc mesenteroides TaxID=1245 RepID=UPI002074321A|nr:phage portal protein [Leuconostoc mesenteroides]MCM6836085.1 phage portal protein [Leuconostoc mesenteroides]
MTNSDIYSVVSLISSDIAGMKFHSDEVTEQLLNKPSQSINGFNFWQTVVAQMLLYGNAYCTINKDAKGVIQGITLLRDDQVSEIIINDGELTYLVNFDEANKPSLYYSSDEMLHFRLITVGTDTNRQIFGRSPLVALAPEITIQGLSNNLTKTTLKNAISPNAIISVPDAQLDRGAKNVIRDGFVDSTTGDNYGKPIVLDASATLSTLDKLTPETASFLSNLDWTKQQISKAFGVPDSYLNGQGDQQSSLQMTTQLYNSSIQRYKNPIIAELELKLGVPVALTNDITDDELIARMSGLVESQIVEPIEANQKLKDRGII